jgi:phospholipid/cholesterol/gamma-HCH transport system substrate-binding protein
MRRLLGLAFVALLAAGAGLSILTYNKAFDAVTWVTLRTDRVGLQLNQNADVKLRDVVVGHVRSIDSDGQIASLRLALDPDLVTFIPRNVHARLLPRTLFGERFVSLVPPLGASSEAIRDGDVITQDRSSTAIELEQVLDDSLKLLQKVKVDKLAATLDAVAAALDGQGKRLGEDIATWDAYLDYLNQEMPDLQEDVTLLAQVLSTFDGAMPDLLALLRDVTVTANTFSQQRNQLHAFLGDVTEVADVTRTFLDSHDDAIIRLGDLSARFARVLAAYASTYPCVLGSIVTLQARATRAFEGGRMHVSQYAFNGMVGAEFYPHQRGYEPGDEPVYGERGKANCRSIGALQNLPGTQDPAPARPPFPLNDGYEYGRPRGTASVSALAPVALRDPSVGLVGSPEERALIRVLVGASIDRSADSVPDIAVLLYGPLLRGGVVSIT